MKTILNIFVLFVLMFDQAAQPTLSQPFQQANDPTATPTSTAPASETPTPLDTPTSTGTPIDPPAATDSPTDTPTPVDTPTDTPAPTIPPSTDTPTATFAPAETETPAITASPTATSSGTPTPSAGIIAVQLNSLPGFITHNGTVILRWSIVIDQTPYSDLRLQIRLPQPFSFVSKPKGNYDSATNTLELPVKKAEDQLVLRVENPDLVSLITASLFDGTQLLSEDQYWLPTHEQFVMGKKGGTIDAFGGDVSVTFPQDALSENTMINVGIPTRDAAPESSPSGRPFEIQAHSVQSGESITQFPVGITISLQNDPYDAKTDPRQFNLVWYDPQTGGWFPLPSSFDRTTNTLTATTDHFTVFDIDVSDWQAARTPTIDAFQVSSYTGAATYSLPIEVPAGPGGLQPSLALFYNSQVVDQAALKTQASWVGMGWSLDAEYIERNYNGSASTVDDTFSINLNGVGAMVVKGNDGLYHTSDEQFWRIEFDATANKWTVWDKVGNKYVFATTAEMAFREVSPLCDFEKFTYRWSLTSVTNIHGQSLTYQYYNQTKTFTNHTCPDDWNDTEIDTAVYLKTITYPNNRYWVRFVREDRLDYDLGWDTTNADNHVYQKYRLGSIVVEQDSDGNGSFETSIRTYQFTYADDSATTNRVFPGIVWSAGGRALTLQSVVTLGKNGATGLPPTTFFYTDKLHLTKATNGYGGSVEFGYEAWYENKGTAESNMQTHIFGKSGQPCDDPRPDGDPWTWQAYGSGSYVRCSDNDLGGPLEIIHTARNTYTPEWMIRPGSYYKVYAKFGTVSFTSNAQVGIRDNKGREYYSEPVALSSTAKKTVLDYFQLGADTKNIQTLLYSSNANNYAGLETASLQLMPTFYRVITKTVNDGNGGSFSYTYSYTGAAMNNEDNSNVCTANPPSAGPTPVPTPTATGDHCLSYSPSYSEFRGHDYVTEIGPDGRKTITYFYQGIRQKTSDPNNFNITHDAFKGRPYLQVIKDNSNQVLAETITRYDNTSYSFQKPQPPQGGWYTTGVYLRWTRTASEESRTYANDGSYTATRVVYGYESQYGNLTSLTRQRWNGTAFANNFTKEVYEYYPKDTTTKYLVGFQAAKLTYSCVGDWTCPTLIAATYSLYDGNTTDYAQEPTTGKLTRTRTWVSGENYVDTGYSYDSWGNRNKTIAYTSYAGLYDPATGARTTTTVFDPDYGTYPVSQTDPLLNETIWEYNYTYGVPTNETDPN